MQITGMPGHLIRRLQQMSTQVFQQHMESAGYDLTAVQFAAMTVLHDNPGCEQAQVATFIAYDRATIGGVIDRLERKGLVIREVSAKDRRARSVRLSKHGELTLKKVYPLVESLQKDILPGLNRQEQQQFIALAGKVVFREL